MRAQYLDSMGTDLTVANAARVSFAKHHEEWGEDDARLIAYLARHQHWSPFAHCMASFHVQAPIFVARQLAKHQVGLAWNEVSRRYVDDEPEFYMPATFRARHPDKKQGSGPPAPDAVNASLAEAFRTAFDGLRDLYNGLLVVGVCPEQARAVLPLATLTEWHWTGSLAAWARVCRLRCADDAQEETREIADQIALICAELWPVSWAALMGEAS